MFTGIIEEMGQVISREPVGGRERLTIRAELVMTDLEVGHSIAVNGVCLTVVERSTDTFTADVVTETLQRSNLWELRGGDRVNLERAMATHARFHGHMVQGHVEKFGFSVVRQFVGHGIGSSLHEGPEIPNYVQRKASPRILEGMVVAIEPMVNIGTHKVKVLKDRWTVITADRKPSAHFEHSVAATANGPLILSDRNVIQV